ncbi:MAG: RidA family protein [Fimbriimonadales bacterium]|nr:RidA family protein [Fimbriimonadales bacterium]
MERRILTTSAAPQAIGPYSQGIIAQGTFLFLSGQLGIRPDNGEFAGPSTADQTRQALANIQALLAEAGLTFQNVVKVTIFLADLNDFAEVNRIYAEVAGTEPPARSTVEVGRLPKDARVEIEVIAVM